MKEITMMKRRRVRLWMAVAMAALVPAVMLAQAPVKSYTPPKTPWGDPDLQGMWPSTDMLGVPLQRPDNLGERAFLTDEEYAQREAQAQRTAAADREDFVKPDAKAGINPPSHWAERGKPQRQASLIVDPANGKMPPLTAEAQRREEARAAASKARGPHDSWEDHPFYDRCISRGILGSIIPHIYNNGVQIVQQPGYVAVRYEMIHETRIIPLDGRPHAGPGIRSYMGDARGHWEGNTLVVETTNFLGDRNGIGLNGVGTPYSASLRVIERFTRIDSTTLNYEATIDDPKTWTRPWKILMPLKSDPDYLLVEYACHEGNYALADILSGARAAEKEAEEAKKKQLK
jgi:hypothetical protein